MTTSRLCFVLLCIPSLVFGFHAPGWKANILGRGLPPNTLWRRGIPPAGFTDPRLSGGSFLTIINDTNPPVGEPLNAIISGHSDSAVLKDQETDGGMRNYFLSILFSAECLGQHSGAPQGGNLGDGNGIKPETAVIRFDYNNPALGSCNETIEGGNHFRYWVQNGPGADTEAVFMATSYEQPIAQGHNIVPNGYNYGRDLLVGNATNQMSLINTSSLTNGSTFSGNTSFGGYTYQSNVQYVSGLLPTGTDGVNHGIALDGLVAVIEVKIVGQPSGTKSSSATWTASLPRTWLLPTTFLLTSLFVFSLYL